MFKSYSVEVFTFSSPIGKMVARGTLIIDDIIKINGFTIFDGSNGLFVTPPQHKGKDKDGNEKWYADVIFLDEKIEEGKPRTVAEKEIYDSFIKAYQEKLTSNSRAKTATANTNSTSSTTTTNRPNTPQTKIPTKPNYNW